MFQFLIKTILPGCRTLRRLPIPTSNVGFLLDPKAVLLRSFSSERAFLMNRLGLSLDDATSIPKLHFPEGPRKVIDFFENRGCTVISCMVKAFPDVILCDTQKTILPKLEFFESKGFSGPEIARMFSAFPAAVLELDLANDMSPSYDYVRNFFQSDEEAIAAVKRFPGILVRENIDKYVAPNVVILTEHGVPHSNIATFMHKCPKSFVASPDNFRKIVEKVKGIGFDASNENFLQAVRAIWKAGEFDWADLVRSYRRWGWSEEEVFRASQKNPRFLIVNEAKIMSSMYYFIGKMGLKPCLIAETPQIVTLSLRKNIVPRYFVFQDLLSKGLVEKEPCLKSFFMALEKVFLRRFVTPYEEEAPELLKLYKEKLENRQWIDYIDLLRSFPPGSEKKTIVNVGDRNWKDDDNTYLEDDSSEEEEDDDDDYNFYN